jgi:TolB protein
MKTTQYYLRIFCIISIFLSVKLPANEHAIVVRLATDTKLLPIYLSDLETGSSRLSSSYLSDLRKALSFDLNYNGKTETVGHTAKIKELDKGYDSFDQLSSWKAHKVLYLIKMRVDGDHISAKLLSVNNRYVQNFEKIHLSGNLDQDRGQIHKLADAIHQQIFGTEGIASTRILYSTKTHHGIEGSDKWISEIWESDYDGANPQQLTNGKSFCISPSYLSLPGESEAQAFMYVSYQTGQPKVYYREFAKTEAHLLFKLSGSQMMAKINRDRNVLAFISDVTSTPDLFVLPIDLKNGKTGKPVQAYHYPQATQASPTFSPDGKQVAFVSNKDGRPRIYVMDVSTQSRSSHSIRTRLITKKNRENTAPAWSPDGSKIAFCALSSDHYRQIWIVDVKTGVETQLTHGPGNKENPTWAKNSLHLIFNSADLQTSELYLVNLNQAEAIKITSGQGEKRYPSWH